MKLLVFACLIAVSLAAPVAKPDDDDDNLAVESDQVVTSVVGAPSVVDTQIFSGTPYIQQNAVAYSVPTSFNSDAKIYSGAVPYTVGVPGVYKLKEIDDDDFVKFEQPVYYGSAYAGGANVAVGPAVTAYSAGQAVASPAITSYKYGQAVAFPSAATYSVGNAVAVAAPTVATHSVAAPSVTTHAVAAPVQYKAAAIAPAVATVHHEAVVQEVKPVSVAVPSAITYEAAHTVQLAPKEINVPVQHQTVQIPVEQRVHYGTENYVAGSTTKVYKPQINAPAIAAPNVFVAKTRHAAPEVTVHQSEVTVEQKSPNYVAAPFDAGVIVEKAAPHINQVDVPTPVEVPHPVNVPTPYAVPVAHPVKVKSSVNPVVNVDVHTVQTENVVTPIEYAAHHHVATAPVFQSAPVVGTAANVVPTAVTYGATGSFPTAVQGVATQNYATGGVSNVGVVTQGFDVTGGQGVVTGGQGFVTGGQGFVTGGQGFVTGGQGFVTGGQGFVTGGQGFVTGGQRFVTGGQGFVTGGQGVVTGGQAVGYAAVPVGQNVVYGSSPAVISGSFGGVPSVTFTGQNFVQGEGKYVVVEGEAQGETASQVTQYSGATQGEDKIVSGISQFQVAPTAQVYFDSSVNVDQ